MKRVAIIGAGHWGPNLIRNFHTFDASAVAWVIDRDPARLELTKNRYADIRVSDEAADAFDDPAVDAVVVATPTSTHYKLARAALLAGKHVLVEKPLATVVSEAEELCRLAEERGLVLMVGHVFLFNLAVQRAKAYLDEDRIGKLHYLSMVRTNLGPIRTDVSAAWDLAAHDVSIANYWLGSTPVAAAAQGGSWINEGIYDTVFGTLWYENGVIANMHVSWLSPRKVRDITAVGARGMLTFDDMNLSEPLRLWDKRVAEQRTPGFIDSFAGFRTSIMEGDIVIPRVAVGEPLRAECDHFLDCIDRRVTPLADGRSGLEAVRVLAAMEESLSNGGKRQEL